jgi:L-rhamnose mutarotase
VSLSPPRIAVRPYNTGLLGLRKNVGRLTRRVGMRYPNRRRLESRVGMASMKSYGLMLCLQDDPEKIAAYKRYHEAVWPEVLARIREVGIERMQIFLRGRRLFMYIDTDDAFEPVRDFPRTMETPKAREWNELMATLQQRAPEAHAHEWWALMESVFDTEWPQYRG